MVYGTAVIVEWAKSESVRNASTCCTDWELIGASTLADGAREIPEYSLTPSTSISILSVKINLFSQPFSVAISHCRCALAKHQGSHHGYAMAVPWQHHVLQHSAIFALRLAEKFDQTLSDQGASGSRLTTWPRGCLLLFCCRLLAPYFCTQQRIAEKQDLRESPCSLEVFVRLCQTVASFDDPENSAKLIPQIVQTEKIRKSDSLSWCFGLGTGWTSLRNGRGRPKLGRYLRHPHDIAHVPDVKLFFAPSCSNCLQCIECIGTGHGDCLSTQDRLN